MTVEVEYQRRKDTLMKARPAYQDNKRRVEETFRPIMVAVLYEMFKYRLGDKPESAVFILAQCQQIAGDLMDAMDAVKYYEAQERNLESFRDSISQTP